MILILRLIALPNKIFPKSRALEKLLKLELLKMTFETKIID